MALATTNVRNVSGKSILETVDLVLTHIVDRHFQSLGLRACGLPQHVLAVHRLACLDLRQEDIEELNVPIYAVSDGYPKINWIYSGAVTINPRFV